MIPSNSRPQSSWAQRLKRMVPLALLGSLAVTNLVLAQVVIDQRPLIAAESVPGNLVLTPSVEWPTINSVANLGNYATTGTYSGYFDSNKCYAYQFSTTESERHFYPVSVTSNGICSSSGTNLLWSGRYLNWAASQTIDPFRKALTGGLRVRDTATETWLEKARHDGQGGAGIYPTRVLSNNTLIQGATPFNGVNGATSSLSSVRVRIEGLGNQMRLVINNGNDDWLNLAAGNSNVLAYDPAVHGRNNLRTDRTYEFSVRVKVCVSGLLESNCVRYTSGWKPEGLIQEYAERLRFSIFGYLNDPSVLRDGAALRAGQKFVGAREFHPVNGWQANALREWDPNTGVLVRNPNPADASNTMGTVATRSPVIQDSGIINYLNKFGQMTTRNHKSFDPVSEMYYAALRYIRGLPNVPQYTDLAGIDTADNYALADGFPVITSWTDPYQYWCQPTAILGIGDVNTHRDKNLPGNTARTDEPGVPQRVSEDTGINVLEATRKVFQLEGITNRNPAPYTGRENSAYIAGMAYHARTVDLRADLRDRQTVSTHWVDVREGQVLAGRTDNQYWLAAKYGGFRVPEGFDPYSRTTALPQAWWSRSGEVLAGSGSNVFIRADNFYVASDATRMIESLRSAFEQVETEQRRSGASLAANSTRLETGTAIYQSIYKSGTFSGDLLAYELDPTTGRIQRNTWQANQVLPTPSARNIQATLVAGAEPEPFVWSNQNAQRDRVRNALGMPSATFSNEQVERVVNYMRGDRSQEQPTGSLRRRTDVLGSIINSQPVFVGSPTPGLYSGTAFTGANSYNTFVNERASRTRMIYVSANDGMLHGFNAVTGAETYAYMPRAVFSNNLLDYTQPGYTHRYFLDGEITVADAYFAVPGTFGSSSWRAAQWRTVLVGTMGRGGRGIFALDVTDPTSIRLIWEKTAVDIPALGNALGKPVIAQVGDGNWRVLVGNGPNSAGDRAQLLSINLADGSATSIDTGVTGSIGLSAAYAWDNNNDGFTERAYAGDLSGGVWRFSGLDTETPTAVKVFQAVDAVDVNQPITASPLVAKNPEDNQIWIFVGTGRYLNTGDLSSTAPQTWYGLIDGTFISSRSSLSRVGFVGDFTVAGQEFVRRVLDDGVEVSGALRGWYFDLPVSGERMVLPNQLRGRVLLGTTRIPDVNDRCAPTGRGFIMAVDPFRGGRLSASFFDANQDGFVNTGDAIDVNGVLIFVSGLGIANAPFSPIFTGNIIQVNREDGTISQILTDGALAQEILRRTSWREIRR